MNQLSYVDLNGVTRMALNKKLFVNEEKRLNFKSYYGTKWKLISYK